jgi:hypothetical protein
VIIANAQPLDFSFLHLQNVESNKNNFMSVIGLKKEEPRAGKRKPIEESEDEEETKKVGCNCDNSFRMTHQMARTAPQRTSLRRPTWQAPLQRTLLSSSQWQ